MAYKGKYTVKNPKKYNGNPNNIIWRSLWERKVMVWLDNNPHIIWWASEELSIPYISPRDDKIHKYYVDFIFKVKHKSGNERIYLWEVKPYKQTLPPPKRKKTKKYLEEIITYAVNQEKWKAAESFCNDNGWTFKLITEKELCI